MVAKGEEGVGEMEWEFGSLGVGVGVCICRYERLYIEWIDKARLYSTENHSQYLVMNRNGNESEKECI